MRSLACAERHSGTRADWSPQVEFEPRGLTRKAEEAGNAERRLLSWRLAPYNRAIVHVLRESAGSIPRREFARSTSGNSGSARRWREVSKRAAVVLLLLAVPILSTLAKNSWYLPQADTAHYLNGAIKMKVSHTPLLVRWEPPMPTAKVFPPPASTERVVPEVPNPPVPDIGITLSLQHRSPPTALL